jgi:hypothetical protein
VRTKALVISVSAVAMLAAMRKALMISVSAVAVLSASQPVFAKDFRIVTKQSAATQLHVSPVTQLHVTLPQRTNNKPTGGATGAVNKPSGGISGLGVPGHLSNGVGADILKGHRQNQTQLPQRQLPQRFARAAEVKERTASAAFDANAE